MTLMTGAWFVVSPSLTSAAIDLDAIPKTNGFYTAKPGRLCTTNEHGFASTSLYDLDRGIQMWKIDDHAALAQMQKAGRFVLVKPGVRVQVELRLSGKTHEPVRIRRKGQTATLWMNAGGLDCP